MGVQQCAANEATAGMGHEWDMYGARVVFTCKDDRRTMDTGHTKG